MSVLLRIAVISLPKFLKLVVLIFVDALMARYLGASDFGLFSYVSGIFLILAALPKFGLDNLFVRDLVGKEMDGCGFTNAIFVRILGGILASSIFAGILWASPFLFSYWPYLLPLGLSYLLFSLSAFEPILQASERFYTLSAAQSLVVVVSAAFKLLLIAMAAPVEAFWATLAVDGLLSVPLTFMALAKAGILSSFIQTSRISTAMMLQYARRGLPFMMASLSVVLYMRADQLMLTWLAGVESVGLYSAALRVSESFLTLATLAGVVVFPRLLRVRLVSRDQYEKGFVQLFRGFLILGLTISLFINLSAEYVVVRLYGEAYRGAVLLLSLHSWVMVPAFWGVVSHRWLVAENLGRFELMRTGLGLGINLMLNFLLIPSFGAAGACVATIISQFSVYVLLNYFVPSLSILGRLQREAVYPSSCWEWFRRRDEK